jgi:hypothetical protein
MKPWLEKLLVISGIIILILLVEYGPVIWRIIGEGR